MTPGSILFCIYFSKERPQRIWEFAQSCGARGKGVHPPAAHSDARGREVQACQVRRGARGASSWDQSPRPTCLAGLGPHPSSWDFAGGLRSKESRPVLHGHSLRATVWLSDVNPRQPGGSGLSVDLPGACE